MTLSDLTAPAASSRVALPWMPGRVPADGERSPLLLTPVRTVPHPTRRRGAELWRHRVPIRDLATGAVGGLVFVSLGGSPTTALVTVALWPALLAVAARPAPRALSTLSGHGGAGRRRALRAGALLGLISWVAGVALSAIDGPHLLLLLTAATTAAAVLSASVGPPRRAQARRLVVVGHRQQVTAALHDLARRPTQWHPVAVCLLDVDDASLSDIDPTGLPAFCGVESVPHTVRHHVADTVLALPGPQLGARDLQRLRWSLETSGTTLLHGTGLADVSPDRLTTTAIDGLHVVEVRLGLGRLHRVKAPLERCAAAALLVLAVPVLAFLALAVRCDSAGPALFRQVRVGQGGREFTIYKFRTMHLGAEGARAGLALADQGAGVLFKVHDDPRITRVGRHLRRFSLDELPQLINVVRGEMALVGPRPALPREVAAYPPDVRRRLVVRPGITGLWQVSGRSDLSWEETVRLDLSYADNWSLGLDLQILLATTRAVLGGRGAY